MSTRRSSQHRAGPPAQAVSETSSRTKPRNRRNTRAEEDAQPATPPEHLSNHPQAVPLVPARAQQQQFTVPQAQRTRQSQTGAQQISAAQAPVLHAPMQQQQQQQRPLLLPSLPLPLPPQQQQQYMSSPLLPMQRHVQYFEPGYHADVQTVQWSDGNPFDGGMVQDSPSNNRYITDAFDRPAPMQDNAQSQSGSDDDEDDDDEEEVLTAPDPDNAPLRRATRKRKEPQFTNTDPEPVTRAPTKRRKSGNVNDRLSTPPPSEGASTLTYVPKVNPLDPSKPLVGAQTPGTKQLIHLVRLRVRVLVVTKNGFPLDDERDGWIRQLVADVCAFLDGGPARWQLFLANSKVREDFLRMGRPAVTGMRSNFITDCRGLVGVLFELAGLDVASCKARVAELFEDVNAQGFNYIFRQLKRHETTNAIVERQGPYRHPLIIKVIRNQLFVQHERMATNTDSNAELNPIPLETIGLVATAMHCALQEWLKGVHEVSSIQFEASVFRSKYTAHMTRLHAMEKEHPQLVLEWRRYMFTECRVGVPVQDPTSEDSVQLSATEMADFSDVFGPNGP